MTFYYASLLLNFVLIEEFFFSLNDATGWLNDHYRMSKEDASHKINDVHLEECVCFGDTPRLPTAPAYVTMYRVTFGVEGDGTFYTFTTDSLCKILTRLKEEEHMDEATVRVTTHFVHWSY